MRLRKSKKNKEKDLEIYHISMEKKIFFDENHERLNTESETGTNYVLNIKGDLTVKYRLIQNDLFKICVLVDNTAILFYHDWFISQNKWDVAASIDGIYGHTCPCKIKDGFVFANHIDVFRIHPEIVNKLETKYINHIKDQLTFELKRDFAEYIRKKFQNYQTEVVFKDE